MPSLDDSQPDPHTLSEDQWFTIDWPLGELRAHYLDCRADNTRREHAFYRYWSGWIKATGSEPVSRATLEEILAHKEWPSPVGNIVVMLAKQGRVGVQDAQWIRDTLPAGSWAHKQMPALYKCSL